MRILRGAGRSVHGYTGAVVHYERAVSGPDDDELVWFESCEGQAGVHTGTLVQWYTMSAPADDDLVWREARHGGGQREQ